MSPGIACLRALLDFPESNQVIIRIQHPILNFMILVLQIEILEDDFSISFSN